MNQPEHSATTVKRILVSLDNSRRGRAALQAAVQLARGMRAELQGLFVEDEDLLRLASLPFSHEIDLTSATARQMSSDAIQRAIRRTAEQTKEAFATTLLGQDLSWTFRVVRGTVARTPLATAADVDLLVIGQQGHTPDFAPLAAKSRSSAGHVVAVFDGSEASLRELELASSLSAGQPIFVLVLAEDGEKAVAQCTAWLHSRRVNAEIHRAIGESAGSIIEFVATCRPSVLFIARAATYVDENLVSRLVNDFECPLVLC